MRGFGGDCLAGVVEAGAHLAKRLTELSQQYHYAGFMPALIVTRQEIDRMIAILGEVLKEFSIATECGFGRRPAETIPQLLRIHAEMAALP